MSSKPEKETDEAAATRAALNRLLAAKSGETRAKLFRQLAENDDILDRLPQFIDMTLAIDDPLRTETSLWAKSYLRDHPGHWTPKMEADLQRSLAGDRQRHLPSAWDEYMERLD